MRKIRNFLCFFICSFYLNCPTTEEQITDRQVLLGVTQKVLSYSKHTLLCLYGHNILGRMYDINVYMLTLFFARILLYQITSTFLYDSESVRQ